MEWTDDKIIQLITFYEQHPCLYDVSDRTYHNRPPFFFFLTSSLLFKNRPNISAAATALSSDESILFVYVLLVPVCVMCVTVATGNCLLVPATGTRNRSV